MIKIRYVDLINENNPGFFAGIFLFILKTASIFFASLVRLRNFLYDRKVFAQARLSCKVISVGNLTAGGTGKTPFVMRLAGQLRDSGVKTAVICRSYSGSEKQAWISDGKQLLIPEIERAGDEPLMLARVLSGVPVGAARDRAGLAGTINGLDIIVLDDGFQHRRLYRDMDIVLLDATADIENCFLLPRGLYREDTRALARADVAVITRSGSVPGESLKRTINVVKKANPSMEILLGRESVSSIKRLGADAVYAPGDFKSKKGIVFTAIGNPLSFKKGLGDSGIDVQDMRVFPDHYLFKEADLELLQKDVDYFITGKDAVKLESISGRFKELNFWVVDTKLDLYDESGEVVVWPKKLERLLSLNIQ